MAMIYFYDPDRFHKQSYLDKDIVFISSRDGLRKSITVNHGIQQILCICSPDKSMVIDEVQNYQLVKAIYWCDCGVHGECYRDLSFHPKNQGGLTIKQHNGWELTCRSTALEICIQNASNEQVLTELDKLRKIEKKLLSLLKSLAENAKLLSNQLNGLDMDLNSREATDLNCS